MCAVNLKISTHLTNTGRFHVYSFFPSSSLLFFLAWKTVPNGDPRDWIRKPINLFIQVHTLWKKWKKQTNKQSIKQKTNRNMYKTSVNKKLLKVWSWLILFLSLDLCKVPLFSPRYKLTVSQFEYFFPYSKCLWSINR